MEFALQTLDIAAYILKGRGFYKVAFCPTVSMPDMMD